jgi:hypothetical protein
MPTDGRSEPYQYCRSSETMRAALYLHERCDEWMTTAFSIRKKLPVWGVAESCSHKFDPLSGRSCAQS